MDPKCFGSDYKENEDVTAFFQKTLDIRKEYDLYAILSEAGIKPGKEYSADEFEKAISDATGATPKISCKSGAIEEVWLYFNVQGNGTYVPTDAVDGSSCSGSIEYPTKN